MMERDSAGSSQEEGHRDGDDVRHAGPGPRQDTDRGARPVADGGGRDARGHRAVRQARPDRGTGCGDQAAQAAQARVHRRAGADRDGRGAAGRGRLPGRAGRLRADAAGQHLAPVPGLATSTATGLSRRFTARHWRGAETGLAQATARMVGLLPQERAAELAGGPVTIDIDATDVEVYGSKKRGVAYTYQGQRAGRPHVAAWAETEIPLAAGLLAGDEDPRSSAVGLLGRALAALPPAVRDGAAAAGRKIALRADAGYFAGDL